VSQVPPAGALLCALAAALRWLELAISGEEQAAKAVPLPPVQE